MLLFFLRISIVILPLLLNDLDGSIIHQIPVIVIYDEPPPTLLNNNRESWRNLPHTTNQIESTQSDFLKDLEQLVYKGFIQLRTDLEVGTNIVTSEDQKTDNDEVLKSVIPTTPSAGTVMEQQKIWSKLNDSIAELFRTQSKQDNQPTQIIQSVIQGIQNFTGNIMSSFQQGNAQVANSTLPNEDEQTGQQPSFGQNFFNAFYGGVQNVINSIQNFGGGSQQQPIGVLGDSGTIGNGTNSTTQGPNLIQGFVNQVSQFFSGVNQQQGDEGISTTTTANPGGTFFQQVSSQVGQVFNNINPFNSNSGVGTTGNIPNVTVPSGIVAQGLQTANAQFQQALVTTTGNDTVIPAAVQSVVQQVQTVAGQFGQMA